MLRSAARCGTGPTSTVELHEAYRSSAPGVIEAFAQPRLPEKIEVYGYGTLPMRTVLGMHIVDYVVHGWDVARAIGSPRCRTRI